MFTKVKEFVKKNKKLLKENMRQSYIIGKQQEKLIMRN